MSTDAEKIQSALDLIQETVENSLQKPGPRKLIFKVTSKLLDGDGAAQAFIDSAHLTGAVVKSVDSVVSMDGGCDAMEAKLKELGYTVTAPE